MKKTVHVKQYYRKKHGRADHGGLVSDHLRSFKPMLARAYYKPPSAKSDRYWEKKYDGTRAIVLATPYSVRIVNRRGKDITSRYPELQDIKNHVSREVVLDGEIVVERGGRDSFKLLSRRDRLKDKDEISKRSKTLPAKFIAFDIVEEGYHPILDYPLHMRKNKLDSDVSNNTVIKKIKFATNPSHLWEQAKEGEAEGVVGKRVNSLYRPGTRTGDWVKIKPTKNIDAVALGYTEPEGKRQGTIGSVVLGAYKDGKLQYIGKVGTGFNNKELASLKKEFVSLRADHKPKFVGESYLGPRAVHWVQPKSIHRIKFQEWTADNHMRMPVWEGTRTDIKPREATI